MWCSVDLMSSPDQERMDTISDALARMIKRQQELESRIQLLELMSGFKTPAPQSPAPAPAPKPPPMVATPIVATPPQAPPSPSEPPPMPVFAHQPPPIPIPQPEPHLET